MENKRDWFKAENIDLHLTAQSEMETIIAMLSLVEKDNAATDLQELAQDLLQHEVVSPSPMGICAVVFRVCSKAAKALRVYFGRFDGGIGYYSRGGHPIDMIFLVIAPPEEIDTFNTIVKKIETLLGNKTAREQLRNAIKEEKIVDILKEHLITENNR